MEIIPITQETASSASHIYALSWKAAYKGIVPQPYLAELSLERWTPFLQSSSHIGFLLKDDDEFVATSSICRSRDEKMMDWGEIISIYVLPKHFHKGYGKKLFAHVVEELRKKGFQNIYLWVLKDNIEARKFYERNGFTANGDEMVVNLAGKDLIEIRYVRAIQ